MKSENNNKIRQDHEPPDVIVRLGWRYHHLGIPTRIPRQGERYLPDLKMHVSGFDRSPFGIEWMRFDPDCAISQLVQTVPHIAFEVDDVDRTLEQALENGAQLLGNVSKMTVNGVCSLKFVYFRDPEGNIVEIQSWKRWKQRISTWSSCRTADRRNR